MKSLNKYINEGFFSNTGAGLNATVDQWLKANTVCKRYTINNDGTIDVYGDITIINKKITEFPDYIQFGKVDGNFDCSCSSLKSLKGAPQEVGGYFDCSFCDSLTSLKGVPEKVGGKFTCFDCDSLKSLKGAPKKVGGSFSCSYCSFLKSLEWAPKEVGGYFDCSECKKQFTEEDVKKVSKVKNKIYI